MRFTDTESPRQCQHWYALWAVMHQHKSELLNGQAGRASRARIIIIYFSGVCVTTHRKFVGMRELDSADSDGYVASEDALEGKKRVPRWY